MELPIGDRSLRHVFELLSSQVELQNSVLGCQEKELSYTSDVDMVWLLPLGGQ